MIVTIDPGHGGDDPGAVGVEPGNGGQECPPHQVTEAELNWTLADWLRLVLEDDGHSPVLTRSQDQGVPLKTRARAAAGSHCLVSIHHNAAESPGARGFEIFIHKPADGGEVRERDMALAALILEECRSVLEAWGIPLRNPPIKADADWASRGRLTVLAECGPPACLLEVSFITNPRELLVVGQEYFQNHMATAIARGITRFGKEVLYVL